MPLRPRHGYAAGFHRDLPSQAAETRTEVPPPVMKDEVRTATQPISAGFELVETEEA